MIKKTLGGNMETYSWKDEERLRHYSFSDRNIQSIETFFHMLEQTVTGRFRFGDDRDMEARTSKFLSTDEVLVDKYRKQINNIGDKLVGDFEKSRKGLFSGLIDSDLEVEESGDGLTYSIKGDKQIEHPVPVSTLCRTLVEKRLTGQFKADYKINDEGKEEYLGIPKKYREDLIMLLVEASLTVYTTKEKNQKLRQLEKYYRDNIHFDNDTKRTNYRAVIQDCYQGKLYKKLGIGFHPIKRVQGLNNPVKELISAGMANLIGKKSKKLNIKKKKEKYVKNNWFN